MEEIYVAVQQAVKKVFSIIVPVTVTRTDEQFGDYTTSIAMSLAAELHQNPRKVAQDLIAELQMSLTDIAEEVTVAGPGFINIKLTTAALLQQVAAAPTSTPKIYVGKKILIEYSDPNPFKPLHAGHLYTTLVGDSISRLVQHAGAETVRLNYGGDVGLHVGKSMWAIINHLGGEHPQKLANVPQADRPAWLGARYVEGNKAYEEDEQAKAQIIATNKKVYQLHKTGDHDSPFAQIYWACRQWSYDYFATLYRQLQVQPFDRFIPESEVTPLGVKTVGEQLKKGVFQRSNGAVIFKGEQFDLHTRVFINSDGLPTYETKDIGLSLIKWRDYHFDKSIIITANEQEQYMQVVLAALKQFESTPAERTQHLAHGVVKLQGGIKISSRKGNGPSALDILAAAREAGQKTGNNPTEQTMLAAVKYAFAKNRIGADVVYHPQESIALEGNSGPYLQYAHARARSILAKAGKGSVPAELQPAERTLARKISEYPEVIAKAATELLPHYVCTYLYELAQTFNRFYEQSRVIGDERQAERTYLVAQYTEVLKAGLNILGITAPDHL